MGDVFKGIIRVITYIVVLVKRTVFTIPFRILKKIAGKEIVVSAEEYGRDMLALWFLAGVSSFVGMPAIVPNVFVYTLFLVMGEGLYDLIKNAGLIVADVELAI